MTEKIEGGCLCGAVRYAASGAPMMVGHCYCTDCRKASGTSHGTHAAFPEPAVSINGQTKAYESAADSGNTIARHFCANCGCALFSTNSAMPGAVFIRASSLDDPSQVTPMMTVYASRAPEWAVLDTARPVFSEMPEGGPQAVLPDA